MIILSGFKKSSTAKPSLKNSGLETTSKSTLVSFAMVSLTLSAVPTGTVLLSTITLYSFKSFPISLAAPKTYDKSADPSSSSGVGSAKNMISPKSNPSFNDVEKLNRPAFIFLSKSTSNQL